MRQIEYRQITSKVSHFPTIVPPNRFLGKGVRFGYSTVSFRAPFLSFKQDGNIKKVLQYVDIVELVSFLSPFGFVLM